MYVCVEVGVGVYERGERERKSEIVYMFIYSMLCILCMYVCMYVYMSNFLLCFNVFVSM